MKTEVILVAAGVGTRLQAKVPKALVLLKGKPLISYSLKVFEGHVGINDVVVVVPAGFEKKFKRLLKPFKKVRSIVHGGVTRSDSVKCGLGVLLPETNVVLVHDAARPFVDNAMLDRLLETLKKGKAAIVGVPVKFTVKKVDSHLTIKETLLRELLWEAQTPQGFHKDVLVKAHAQRIKQEATDDAMMVESLGIKVRMVMGSYRNIKITTQEDLILARQFL